MHHVRLYATFGHLHYPVIDYHLEGNMGIIAKQIQFIWIIVLIAVSCAPQRSTPTAEIPLSSEASSITNGWPTTAPEVQGMDADVLTAMLAEIDDQAYGIDSVTVIRNGQLVLDVGVYPYHTSDKHIIHSCTKSIVSALIGIAIAEGYIDSVNMPVLEIFSGQEVANIDQFKEDMTIEHLLTMTSGLDCQDSYLYRWDGLNQMRASTDWVQHMLDLPMIAPPGTHFEYCNGASFLLSAIISEKTGMSAHEFAEQHLFGPLGITDVTWPKNPQGINIGWGELRMRPQDMAKIGYLYLKNGVWEGEQVVPAEWVAASTAEYISATLEDGYGYQWWVSDAGYYLALGYAGQFIFVLPEKDLVAVFTSDLEERDFYTPQNLFNEHIIPAAVASAPLPANPGSTAELNAEIDELSAP